MPNFRTLGSTGQAPTTSWFGPIPDRLTLLWPAKFNTISGDIQRLRDAAATTIDTWNPVNVGVGPGITAPDGTATAHKLSEDTSTSIHSVTAGTRLNSPPLAWKARIGVIAKAAERTRIAVYVTDKSLYNPPNVGLKTVFDLVGGQTGVAQSLFGGSPQTPGTNSVTPLGNGWYCCYVDLTQKFPFAAIFVNICLDAGAGTTPEDTNYAGDGHSGVYIWKTVFLPQRAWSLTDEVFFDDFTSLSTIDVNDTCQPGFKWYPRMGSPVNYLIPTTPPSALSVSNSILTILPNTLNANGHGIRTNAWPNFSPTSFDPAWVGTTFKLPALFEIMYGWGFSNGEFNDDSSMFTESAEQEADGSFWVNGLGTSGNELDFNESNQTIAGLDHLNVHSTAGTGNVEAGVNAIILGFPKWSATQQWNTNNVCGYQGQLYKSLSANVGNVPSTSPTFWTVYTPGNTEPTLANTNIIDLDAQHLYSVLWLPYVAGDMGMVFNFFDNACVCASLGNNNNNNGIMYAPSSDAIAFTVNPPHVNDGRSYPCIIQISGGGHSSQFVDYVRVTQGYP